MRIEEKRDNNPQASMLGNRELMMALKEVGTLAKIPNLATGGNFEHLESHNHVDIMTQDWCFGGMRAEGT